jgi:trimeric autotransporter adhesin
MGVVRGIVVAFCIVLIFAVLLVCLATAQEAPPPPPPAASFQISGNVKSGKTALPGVTVTATNTLTGKKVSAASALDGSFLIKGLPRGRYVLKVEFMGFASHTEEVVLNPENPAGKVDVDLLLVSRQLEQSARRDNASAVTRGFQNLALDSLLSNLGGDNSAGGTNSANSASVSAGDLASLPMNGAGADAATESVNVAGAQGRAQDFGFGNEDDLQQRIQEYRERAQQTGGNTPGGLGGAPGQVVAGGPAGGGPGGPGGAPGGGFGGGGAAMMIGRLGRGGFNSNQPHGFLYFQDDDGALDARPYSLAGLQSQKASYNKLNFGSMVGGPLKIPHLFDWSKSTFFTVGWNGSRGSTPFDEFSTVPTLAERSGDFSGLTSKNGTPVVIYNPQTGQPFANNSIDPTQFNSAAVALLNYIPMPNLPGTTQNFHYVTSAESNTDAISLRLIHNFSGTGPGFGPLPGGFGGAGGGGKGRRGPRNNINFGLNWSRSSTNLVNSYPSLAGHTDTQGLNANTRWTYGKGRLNNTVGFSYNHNRAASTNLYSGVVDVAGNAGITGISQDPFNWGLPGISFTSFGGLSNPTPSRELDQTYTVSDTLIWNHGKNNWRFGGDYRRILQGFRSARNAEGSFIFTGFATAAYLSGSTQPQPDTGNDFADFLLGLPQQTTLQSGTTNYEFRANSYDAYVQNDWRLLPNLSLNLGLRYEYISPFSETDNRIANLDVSFSPQSITAFRVLTGQAGPFNGTFPPTLVHPDRNNFAPRIGLAWRLGKGTVVRSGYGINYNLAQYGTFIRNFAFQPPFAAAATNVSPYGDFLTLQNGFPGNTNNAVTNNYALSPNYRLGYVQIWNLDIQRQLPGNVQLNFGYNGAKGTHLDSERALVPTCVSSGICQATEAAAPFIYESSEGNSILHAASVRVRKRLSKGLGIGASYVFSKSIDDASSIGLDSTIVVQNPFDISAERSVSSFDQKHKFIGNWIYQLPFGDGHRFFNKGLMSHALEGWQWSGDFTIASGLYFTPSVLGAALDINRGVTGSQRANVIAGVPISLTNPTTAEWFNTAAFCAPGPGCVSATGTTFGDAGRYTIEGPRQITFDMAISKTFTIRESRALELRLQGNNIFNTPYFSGINTVVNSLTFGQVTSVSNMRRVAMVARFRF